MLLFSKIFRIPLRSGVEVEQFIVSILLTPSKYIRRSNLSKDTNTNKVNAVVIEAAKNIPAPAAKPTTAITQIQAAVVSPCTLP